MLFSLQKLIWFAAMPPASLILLMLFGLAVSCRYRRVGMALIGVATAMLYLLSTAGVANLLTRPLERAARPLSSLPEAVDAVVVPGGGSVDLSWCDSAAIPNAESWTRLAKGIELARALHCPLILTGGNGEPFATSLNDADVMATAACNMGMPRAQVIVENASRNTLENSHAVRRLLKGNRIVLATSAYYMRRAVAMFERRGFTVIPAPTYQHVQSRKWGIDMLIPRAGALAQSSMALAEWLGMAWWRIRGEL